MKEKIVSIFSSFGALISGCFGPCGVARLATGCCGDSEYTIFSEDYSNLEGYNPEADLGLGCGIPTEFAKIKPGDTVIDLGSGAGNDCFVARAMVGENGLVIGVDFTHTMLIKSP